MVRTVAGAIAGRISPGLSLLTNAGRFSIVPSLHLLEEVSDDRHAPPISPLFGPLGFSLVSVHRTCRGRERPGDGRARACWTLGDLSTDLYRRSVNVDAT